MSKIVISGTPDQFNQEVLNQRQNEARNAYRLTSQSCEVIRGGHANQFLQNIIDRAAEGYTLTEFPATLEPINYAVQMRKPLALQAEDLLKIHADVRAAYKTELEASHESYNQRLYEQLVQVEEAKQAAKVQAAKDKVYADLKRQAEACYQPLSFPDA